MTIAHSVICLYCQKRFDADIEPFEKPNKTRYAHLECHKQAMEARAAEEKDKTELEDYIKKLFNIDYVDAKIRKQIKTYMTEYNYTYSGILFTLRYAYEVKNNDISKANGGIGIVPYLYREAYNYKLELWSHKQKNEDKVISDYKPQEVRVVIPIPERKPMKKRKFTFLDNEEFDT